MDKRLNQIQTGSLTDSRMNEDFVYWMKTTGLNILLIILLIGCGYMGWHWWHRTQSQTRAQAWQQLERAATPQELAIVASERAGIGSIAFIAKLRAADGYLDSIVSGIRFDRDPTAADAKVTNELRVEWLDTADRLYAEVAEDLSRSGTAIALQPTAFHALLGRAAVAESRGDAAAAQRFLDQASSLVEKSFPALAAIAKGRGEGLVLVAAGIELPPRDSLPAGSSGPFLPGSMNLPNIPGLQITPGGTASPNVTMTPVQGPPPLPFPPPVNDPNAPAPRPAPPGGPAGP
ncbi:MAG: hypothetical protein KF724_10880 [Phycisphaeraceae bacterium]|nr:hypothetical protein [Phycisphaeraceae bacterium]